MPRETRQGPPQTTPQRFADTTPPLPSGDYSYILEIVMGMQVTMGKLLEASDALKGQSAKQGEKLDQIGKDVHAAKIVVSVVVGLILVTAGLVGWVITTYIAAHPGK